MFSVNEEVLLLGKALIIGVLGILLGFILKHLARKTIDNIILKRILKDPNIYETASIINKVLTEILLWVIIVASVNYSLVLLNFDFLSKVISYILGNVPRIAIFVLIILGGYLLSKIVVSAIRGRNIENEYEIISLVEIVIMVAFMLTALEYIGVKATALIELYKVVLYVIGILIILIIVNPKVLGKKEKESKKGKK